MNTGAAQYRAVQKAAATDFVTVHADLVRRIAHHLAARLPASVEIDDLGARGVLERIKARVGERPVYLSVDIDVLDPAFAPGTGTPEAGGMTSRELLAVLRGFADLNLVGADLVEVAPVYDHAEITGIAASHAVYEMLSALSPRGSVDAVQEEQP